MKKFRVVITDTTTGEQHIHDLEALAVLGIRERNNKGIDSMVDARHITPQEVAQLAVALLDNMTDCDYSHCSADAQGEQELDKVADHIISVLEKLIDSRGDQKS